MLQMKTHRRLPAPRKRPPPAAGEEGEGEGDACSQALAATEESVRDKLESGSMNDADTEKVNELLDQADAQCTEGDMDGGDDNPRRRSRPWWPRPIGYFRFLRQGRRDTEAPPFLFPAGDLFPRTAI